MKPHCYPIKATSELVDTGNGNVSGKFMEKMKTSRKLTTYLIEPRDVTSLPEKCIKFRGIALNEVFFSRKWKSVFEIVTKYFGNFLPGQFYASSQT